MERETIEEENKILLSMIQDLGWMYYHPGAHPKTNVGLLFSLRERTRKLEDIYEGENNG